nr:hypothetical protein [Tanacetum cinerariifolium]
MRPFRYHVTILNTLGHLGKFDGKSDDGFFDGYSLNSKPKLGLWYTRDTLFELVAYTDSDYAGASLDRKSITVDCQFLSSRLISWQCKKQTVVATSTAEAEYVTAASCCGNYCRLKIKCWIMVDMEKPLVKDTDGDDIDVHLYRSMIGSLMYLTASRPDIMDTLFELVAYTDSDYAGASLDRKSITVDWQDTLFELVAYTDSDYAGASLDRKSITVDCQFLSSRLISWQCKKQTVVATSTAEAEYVTAASCCGNYCRLKIKCWIMVNPMIFVTPSHTNKIFANMKRKRKDFSGKVTPLFEIMMVQPQEDRGKDSKIPIDSHHTPNVPQPSTSFQPQQKQKSKKSKKKITEGRSDQDMFDTSILDDKEVVAEKEVNTVDPVFTTGEVVTTIGKGDCDARAIWNTYTNTNRFFSTIKGYCKDKAKMIEPEKPLKRKDKIMIGEEVARNLKAQMQAELEEDERIARQKEEESNITLIESLDNIQAIMDADYELAARLQEEERGELTIEEKSRNVKATNGSEKAKEGSSKRAAGNLEQEDAKRQRIDEENESAKLKRCLEIIFDDDNDNFNKEDLDVLWSIVKARFKKTKPVDDMDNLLFQTLKNMFKHHVEENIRKYQQGTVKVLNWKLFNSCGFMSEELSAAKQKLMLLDSAVEGRLMLLSQVNAANYIDVVKTKLRLLMTSVAAETQIKK